jgi:hypothetical protein
MKKIFFTCLFIFTLIGSTCVLMSFKSDSKEENLIVVKIFESDGGAIMVSPKIIISDSNTILHSIELEKNGNKKCESNSLKITAALKMIKNQGYQLVSSNSGGDAILMTTNYVFEKK